MCIWGLSRGIQPCTMKNRDIYWRRYQIQQTLYIGQWCLCPLQSRHLGTSHSSSSISSTVQNTPQNPLLESPSAAPSYFSESDWWSEISSLSKVILVLGKARSLRAPNLGLGHWVTWVIWCVAKKLCRRCDAWVIEFLWWSYQSPVAHSCGLLNHPNSEECSSLMKNLMQIHCSTHSVILNVMATQYTCSFNSIYCPYWLVQWNSHCSRMCIPVHSPWLPGYIEVAQTILVILTMAGLFPDTPHMYISC